MKHISSFLLLIIFSNLSVFCQETIVKDSIIKDRITKNTIVKDSIKNDSVIKSVKKKKVTRTPIYYIDENGSAINEFVFNQKCNAAVFYCKVHEKKDMIIYKVYYQMYFGKITPVEYNEIRLYLNRKSNKTIPENHKILIHYEQTLSGFKERHEFCDLVNSKTLEENFEAYNLEAELHGEYPFKSLKAFNRHVQSHKREYHNEDKFNSEVAEYADKQNKCLEKIETKYKTPVFYVVNDNFNYPIKNKYFTWVVDDVSTIQSAFLKKHPDINFILLKPDGEYFIKTDFMPETVLNKLLKKSNWESQKNEWLKSIKTNKTEGYGIVNSMTKEYEFYNASCY